MKVDRTDSLNGVGLHYMRGALVVLLAVCLAASTSMTSISVDVGTALAGSSDDKKKKKKSTYPPPSDPSAFGPFVVDDLPDDLPEANEGAFEGGQTGTNTDASDSNTVGEEDQRDDGVFNVPTNGPPSPLFWAEPFSQQMLRFEEFGTEKLKLKGLKRPHHWQPLPAPADAQSAPDGDDLEDFLSQGIWPKPMEFANDSDRNPWESQIESYLGRDLNHPPAEGRPPGQGWSH